MDFDEYYRLHHPSDQADPDYAWHPRHPISIAYRFQLERAILEALSTLHDRLGAIEVLDVGCGSGRQLRYLVEIGANPEHLHGIDLLDTRVADARRMSPSIDVTTADATAGIGFPDERFDLVTQFVALSSILDHAARRRCAREMVRVARVGGHVLHYDMVRPNAGCIPDGIPATQLEGLYPNVRWLHQRRIHNRVLAKLARHPLLAEIAERAPLIPKTNLIALGVRTA